MPKPTKNAVLAEVWTCIKSAPYFRWNDELRDQLFMQLQYMGEHLDTDEQKERFTQYINYLWVNYFDVGQFSLMTGEIADYYSTRSDDITNNSVESKNYSLNSSFPKGRKTLAGVCQKITDFKRTHQTERMYALKQNNKRYFRKRDPKRIKIFENRRQIIHNFTTLPLQEQCNTLWDTMYDIGQLPQTVSSTTSTQ